MPVNLDNINAKINQQDQELRDRLQKIASQSPVDTNTRILGEILAEALCCIHERQGNAIMLGLQTR